MNADRFDWIFTDGDATLEERYETWAGIALRRAGWTGRLIGIDLSQGMLDQAAVSSVYDELVRCSLLDVPRPDAGATAIRVERRVHARPCRRRGVRRALSNHEARRRHHRDPAASAPGAVSNVRRTWLLGRVRPLQAASHRVVAK
jgi:hypothetical protein